MQAKRVVPGVTDYYVHDEDGCPLYRMSTASHDSLCDWLMPVVEFAQLSLGEKVTPVLVFDRDGAYPEAMAELRNAGAEFITYERQPYAELPANDFPNSLTITTASHPTEPVRISLAGAPRNLRGGRGRVRRISVLTDDGRQVNVLAVSKLPAEMLLRRLMARWGAQETPKQHQVERWGINHLDGRRVAAYPPDAIIPKPRPPPPERVLKLSHTAQGEALRQLVRMQDDDPDREEVLRDVNRVMERQKDLMAQRAFVPRTVKVGESSLAGTLTRHELGYKIVLDTVRTALANVEADLAVLLAKYMDRPREAKKLLAILFAAPTQRDDEADAGRLRHRAGGLRQIPGRRQPPEALPSWRWPTCGFFSGASEFATDRFSEDFPNSSLFRTESWASSWASRSCRSAGLAPFSARFSLVSAMTFSMSRRFSPSSSFAAWRRPWSPALCRG